MTISYLHWRNWCFNDGSLFHTSLIVSFRFFIFLFVCLEWAWNWKLVGNDSLQLLLYLRSVLVICRCITKHPEFSCLKQECIFSFHGWWIAKHSWAHFAWGFSSNRNQLLDGTAAMESLNLLDAPGGSLTSLEVGFDYLLAAQRGLSLGVPAHNFSVWPELPNNPDRAPWVLWCSLRVTASLSALHSLGYIDLPRFKVRGAVGGGENQEWIIGEAVWGKVTFFKGSTLNQKTYKPFEIIIWLFKKYYTHWK